MYHRQNHAKDMSESMELLEITSDSQGETHFRRTTIDLLQRDFAPPSKPVAASAETPANSSLFLEAPPGWDDTFHTTPRRQLAVLLGGTLKVTVSDGETVTMAPGDIVLLNDLSGKGHLSQVQGDQPARFLLVGYDG